MPLTSAKKKHYKTLAHDLKPIVTIAGNGLSKNVTAELDRALEDHELIKVKLMIENRDDRKHIAKEICTINNAEIVQEIGKVAVFYRAAKKSDPKKTNLR